MQFNSDGCGIYFMTYAVQDAPTAGVMFDAHHSELGWVWGFSAGVRHCGAVLGWMPCHGFQCPLRARPGLHSLIMVVDQTIKGITAVCGRGWHPLRRRRA